MGVSTTHGDDRSSKTCRFGSVRAYLPRAVYEAQWQTFLDAWGSLGDVFDKKLAADERSRSFDSNESAGGKTGNFDGAGTGGQD